MLTKIEAVKLPWRVRILYSSGEIAKSTIVVMTMMFSLYFYTEIIGINSGVAATIILVAKIWDIVNDPMMGALVDRTRSKDGKCRMWLKYMSVPGGVLLVLAFFMPELTMTGKIIWVAITYTLQGMGSTALMIPMNTMMGRLTSDPVERAVLNQVKSIFALIPSLAVPAITMPLVLALGKGDMQKGFLYVGILYGIIFALFNLTVYWGTRGYEPLEHLEESAEGTLQTEKVPQPSLGAALKALMQNKPWLLCIGVYMADMIAMSISNTVLTFYCQYNLQNINIMSVMSMSASFAGLPIYFTLSLFIKRFGNSGTSVLGCVLTILGYGIRFLFHDANMAVIIAGCVIGGFGAALVGSTVLLCIFDAKVYGEWKTGVDNEAILMSGYSVSYKTGQTLGGPIAGYLLMTVPYAAQAAVQEQSVLNLWFYESTLFPIAGFVLALIFALKLRKYEKRVPEMRAEIEARKQKTSA